MRTAVVAAIACSGSAYATATASAAQTLTGAGSTLVQPIEAYWANGWNAITGNSVTYSAVGSGTGIKDISANQVAFGASDAPMTTAQAAGCNTCIQIPWALSATGIGYNLKGVKKLQLTGSILAQIYLGQITTWNNPAIAKINKGVKLPAEKITPVFRTDGSGDTYAFTNYLSHVNSTFSSKVGIGTAVQFPTGSGGSGNLGVTNVLTSTPGAIAYVAVSYLIAHQTSVAAIQNAAGKYEYPNLANISNAANYLTVVPNGYSIVDPPKKAKIAYPISTFTYVIVPTNSPVGSLLQSFITYAITTGQKYGQSLDFAPLPAKVLSAAKADVAKIG